MQRKGLTVDPHLYQPPPCQALLHLACLTLGIVIAWIFIFFSKTLTYMYLPTVDL